MPTRVRLAHPISEPPPSHPSAKHPARRVRLTKSLLDSLPLPTTESDAFFLRDTAVAGFGVRVRPGGLVFILDRRIQGRPRRLTIAKFGDLTVEQARAEAQTMTAAIVRGDDPSEAKRARKGELTFGELAQEYRDRHLPHKKSAANDEGILRTHLKPWMNQKLSAITRADLARLHGTFGKQHPYWANRVVALVRVMFNLATDWGYFHGVNPARGIKLHKEQARDRFLSTEEVQRFLMALNQESDPAIRAAFLVLLLTGARRGEALSMRWSDVDVTRAVWTKPLTKAGRSHTVPLVRPVLEALAQVPRLDGNPFVFMGRWQRGHLEGVRSAWVRIIDHAALDEVRLHDLRRTLGSWLAISGTSLSLIGKALGHSRSDTTSKHYAHLTLDPVRVVLEQNAALMLTGPTEREP